MLLQGVMFLVNPIYRNIKFFCNIKTYILLSRIIIFLIKQNLSAIIIIIYKIIV